jgi:glycosyltransferase involved in cell wall biosynthesis
MRRSVALRVHHVAVTVLVRALGQRARVRRSYTDGPVVSLLLHSHGMGGATRSVLTLLGEVVKDRPVELVSIVRKNATPRFPIPADIHLTILDDRRRYRSVLVRALSKVPSVLMHPADDAYAWFSLWTDVLLVRRVRQVRNGVLMTSRPAVSALVAQIARPEVTVVVQEHTHLGALVGDLPATIGHAYATADAVVLLTERDREQYATFLHGPLLTAIPNAVPRLPGEPADDRRNVIVAAGRLTRQKGFDLLIRAFAQVAEHHPDWRVEVYGEGADRDVLAAQIDDAGLSGVMTLEGATQRIGEVLASSAIFALSSRWEGMPIVVLEAMSKGAAVVAFDCPTGPRELIHPDRDGLLVPAEDVDAFATALDRVMSDVGLRKRLGAAALRTAGAYTPDAVGAQWLALLDRLASAPGDGASVTR